MFFQAAHKESGGVDDADRSLFSGPWGIEDAHEKQAVKGGVFVRTVESTLGGVSVYPVVMIAAVCAVFACAAWPLVQWKIAARHAQMIGCEVFPWRSYSEQDFARRVARRRFPCFSGIPPWLDGSLR